VVSYKHCNEPWGSTEGGNLLIGWSDHEPLKMNAVPLRAF